MCRLIYLILFVSFLYTSMALAATRTVVTRTPYYYNPNQLYHSQRFNNQLPSKYCHRCSNFSDINALERYTMHRNYARENDLARLERLEMQAFGALQQGDMNIRYDNVRKAILSRPKQNYKTSLLRNIGDYFAGQMTGYTPSLGTSNPFYSSSQFPTTYGNSSFEQFSGPFGSSGYRINNYSTGSNAGIRLLD